MKYLSIVLALLAMEAKAFNAADWHGKRELMTREAERLMAAYSNCVARLQTPAEDVTVPLDTFDDGSDKVLISAKKAQYFLDSGLVWAEDVVVRRFKKGGALEAQIDAKNCVVDRLSKSGWSDGPTVVTHGKTVFAGRGVYFSASEGYVKVFHDADIVSEDLKFGGVYP